MRLPEHTLVTGAGGFVPRTIVTTLLASGLRVTAVDRAFDPDLVAAWHHYGDQVTCIEGDATALPDIHVDAVVHGAALTTLPEDSGMTPEAHLNANLQPTLAVLEWAHLHGARRTIVISSSGVYAHTAPGPVSEDQPPTPQGTYAIAKALTESFANTLRTQYGRDVVCIRLSSIYGKDETARASRPRVSLVSRYVEQALTGGTIVVHHPDEARDWTYADDIGGAVQHLLKNPGQLLPYALFNVASGEVISNRQIAEAIQSHLPGVAIVVDDQPEPGIAPLTRLGYLSNQRLKTLRFGRAWTPFTQGIGPVIACAQSRLSLEAAS